MRQTQTAQRQPRDSQPQAPLYQIKVSHYTAGELTSENVATHSRDPYLTLQDIAKELRLARYKLQPGTNPLAITAVRYVNRVAHRVTYRATLVADETAVEPMAKAQAYTERVATSALTEKQQTQLAIMRRWEAGESLTNQPVIQVTCHTCKESKEFRSVDGARSFVLNHAGHYTWVDRLRNERPSLR